MKATCHGRRTASRCTARWAPTASACPAWSAASSRRATTMPASSGRKPWRRSGGDPQPEAGRRGLRSRSARALRRRWAADACTTIATSRRRQVRRHGPDRQSLAGHRRPEGAAAGKAELKSRRDRPARRKWRAPRTRWPGSWKIRTGGPDRTHVWRIRTRRRLPLSARPPRRALRFGHRRLLLDRHRTGRRDPDRGHR